MRKAINLYLDEEVLRYVEKVYGRGCLSKGIEDIVSKFTKIGTTDTVRLVICKNCGARFSSLLDDCPQCQANWRMCVEWQTKVDEVAYKTAYELMKEEGLNETRTSETKV